MGRGLFFGLFWGTVVGGLVLTVASLLGGLPGAVPKGAAVMNVPAESEFGRPADDSPAQVTIAQDQSPAGSPSEPTVTAPTAPPAPSLSSDITASASVPETSEAPSLAPPPETPTSSGVVVQLEAPTAPSVDQGQEAALPRSDPEPQAVEQVAAGNTNDLETAAIDDTAVPAAAAPAGEETSLPDGQVILTTPEPALDRGLDVEVLTPTEEREIAPQPDQNPTPQDQLAALTERPQVSEGGFSDRADGVTTARLPSVGGDAGATAAAKAIDAFARTDGWPGADGRPLLAIVLLDETGAAQTLPALASFPGPLTFAVPAARPEATQAMGRYRAAGHEVALIADVPVGAEPSDLEIAFQTYLETVPEAVAVLDGTFNGFNGDRRVLEQVTRILSESGHGLVTFDQGLTSVAQTAEQAGVPAISVYRDLDREGQDARIIGRFLDQAAFRAGQEQQMVLIGRMRADTITALLIWAQQDRANRVNIAPLSAVLRRAAGLD